MPISHFCTNTPNTGTQEFKWTGGLDHAQLTNTQYDKRGEREFTVFTKNCAGMLIIDEQCILLVLQES